MILENENIKIECLIEHGGKLSSIFDKRSNFELLFQNPKGIYKRAECGSCFEEFEACGFDDAFPSIDKESVIYNGKKLDFVDHGEIWSSIMSLIDSDDNSLTLAYDSKIHPYHYEKCLKLRDRGIACSYKITNTGDYDFPCFYTFHCLVNCNSETFLLMPSNTEEILMVSDNSRFSKKQTSYPISSEGIDVSRVNSLEKGKCEKFYVINEIDEGLCGYMFPKKKLKALINYNQKELPYLGFWNTQGGFRGDYNVALEMSNGFYDSISIALNNNRCPILKPKQIMTFSFNIDFEDIIN